MQKSRSNQQLVPAPDTEILNEDSEDPDTLGAYIPALTSDHPARHTPKKSTVDINAVTLPVLSAFQQLVEKEMLAQEITVEVPEEEPEILPKNTMKAKMRQLMLDSKPVESNESLGLEEDEEMGEESKTDDIAINKELIESKESMTQNNPFKSQPGRQSKKYQNGQDLDQGDVSKIEKSLDHDDQQNSKDDELFFEPEILPKNTMKAKMRQMMLDSKPIESNESLGLEEDEELKEKSPIDEARLDTPRSQAAEPDPVIPITEQRQNTDQDYLRMQEETESEHIRESQRNSIFDENDKEDEKRGNRIEQSLEQSPFAFDHEGQIPNNMYQDGASSEIPEDITLSSSDSVICEMRSMKKMAIVQACQQENVNLKLSQMTQEQIDSISMPIFFQVVEFFKQRVDPSMLSDDQKYIYKNLSIAANEDEFDPVLAKEIQTRNATITVVGNSGDRTAGNAKFEVSNIKNFKVINQDFYTKSLGNKSTPRNEEMLGMDSMREQSLNEDEPNENGEQADFALSHPQIIQESRDQIPGQPGIEPNAEQLQEMEDENSIAFQNRDQSISKIDRVEVTDEQGTPDITLGLSPPTRIVGAQESLAREKFSSVPHGNIQLSAQKDDIPEDLGEGTPNLGDNQQLNAEDAQNEYDISGTKATVDLGPKAMDVKIPKMSNGLFQPKQIVPVVEIVPTEGSLSQAQTLKKIEMTNMTNPDPKGSMDINKTGVNFQPGDPEEIGASEDESDKPPLIMKGSVDDVINESDIAKKREPGTVLPFQKSTFNKVMNKGPTPRSQSEGLSVDLSEESAKKLEQDEQGTCEDETCTVKNCDCKKGDPAAMMGGPDGGGDGEDDEDEEIALSWKALVRSISVNHPVHPLTKEKFQLGDRTTVNGYMTKLLDPCQLNVAVGCCRRAFKKYYKLSRGDTDERKMARPDSLKDLPESESESSELEDEVGFGGLTAAGAHLGVGAIVYLQTMKTFVVLFFILTILNMPVYLIYSQTTLNNEYNKPDKMFQYFTYGNFGSIKEGCSSVSASFDSTQTSFNLQCDYPNHYMTQIKYYGFLYQYDPRVGASSGQFQCEQDYEMDMGKAQLRNPEAWAGGWQTAPIHSSYAEKEEKREEPENEGRLLEDESLGEQSPTLAEDPSEETTASPVQDFLEGPGGQVTPENQQSNEDLARDLADNGELANQNNENENNIVVPPLDNQANENENNDQGTLNDAAPQDDDQPEVAAPLDDDQDPVGAAPPGEEEEDHSHEMGNLLKDLLEDKRLIQNTTISNLDTLCQSKSKILFKDEDAYHEIQDYFQKYCYEQEECVFNLENLPVRPFSEMISETCKIRMDGDPSLPEQEMFDKQITSKEFLIVFGCQGSVYKLNDMVLHKQQFATLMVVIDFIGVLVMVYIFDKLEGLNKEYLDIIDDNQITMKDFAVACKNVVLDKYTQDLRLVKMKIWLHFTRTFKEYRLPENDYEVTDVVLSLCNQPETLQIINMERVQNEINVIKNKLAAGEFKGALFFQKQEELEDLNDNYEREKDRYQQYIDNKKKSKAVGIVPKCHRIERLDYIFVTYKNVECVPKVLEVLAKEPGPARIIRCMFCIKNKVQTDKEFLREEITVTESVEPDEILWTTLMVPGPPTNKGAIILYTISAIFITFSGAFQLVFEGLRFRLIAKEAPLLCPIQAHKDSLIKNQEAYDDLLSLKPKGLLPCFCKQEFRRNPFSVPTMQFTDIDPDEMDMTYYCLPWFTETMISFTIKVVSAISITALNALIARTFKGLSTLQSRHTTIETTQRSFLQIQILEFMNTGLIMCLVSFIGLNKALVTYENWEIAPEKIGYEGFDSQWYFEVGRILTLSCFLSVFASNGADLRGWCKTNAKQRADRGGDANIKRFPHDEDDDTPNTKKMTQDDLEKIYEGPSFDAESVLARMMSVTWTCIVFSSGMPILYVIGFLFYFVTYMTNKHLIMKYYKRTDSVLSREIPITAVWMMRYAIVLKMLVGIYMLNNPSIIRTRDQPTEDDWFLLKFKVPIKSILNKIAVSQGNPEPYPEDQEGDGEASYIDYIHYLHQQVNVALVIGSFSLYFCYLFGMKFGVMIYAGTIGALINILIKVWFLLKFLASFTYEILKKLYRFLKKKVDRLKSKFRARSRKTQALVLMKAGKEHQSADEIDADEDRILKKKLKKQDKAWKKQDAGEEEDDDDQSISKSGQSQGSVGSTGALGAIEEATRKMKIAARQAYEDDVIGSRADRTDYSSNIYKELNMISLDQLYERSKKEHNDFKALFGMNQATEKYMFTQFPRNKKSEKIHRLRDLFLEQCYMSNITEEDVKEYDDLLKKRIRDIEEAIDSHFEFIKTAIREDAEEKRDREIEKTFEKEDYRQKIDQALIEHKFATNPDLNFENLNYYTHIKKLEQLKDHQDNLIKAEKNDMNNRRNLQRICRMQGSLAQSYLIFDNTQFKEARKIYFKLEAEEQELRNQKEDDDLNEYESGSDEDTESEEGQSQDAFLPKKSMNSSDDSEILDEKQLK